MQVMFDFNIDFAFFPAFLTNNAFAVSIYKRT